MKKFDYMEKYAYEQLVLFHDKATGLKAITCIHNTVLGPALGGTRFWDYKDAADPEEAAIEDALRLARGMSYKNAMAGLPLGGGKSVVIGNPEELRKDSVRMEAFWRAFGRYVEGLGGRYVTAADVGTITDDMVYIHMETNNVVGLPGKSGDPSPKTALGVYKAVLACCKHVYGSESLSGKTVAVQGLGKVGYALCEYLHKDGAKLIVTDMNEKAVADAEKNFGAQKVAPNDIYSVQCDIYAPCALGASINDETIPKLKCKIVCGAANNVLKDAPIHGKALHDKGIIYAPDYVANAGGVINVAHERIGYNEDAADRDVVKIYGRILEILEKSKASGKLPHEIADQMAEARINAVKGTKGIYLDHCCC